MRARFTFLLILLSHLGLAGAASIGFNLSDVSVNVGDRFTLDVLGSGFTDGITGGGLNIGFNPGNLNVESVSINTTAFDFLPLSGTIDNVGGQVSDTAFNAFFADPGTDFTIMSVDFLATGAGSSDLQLSESLFWTTFDTAGNYIGDQILFSPTHVNVSSTSPVPLPGAVWLFASALLGMVAPQVKRRLG